MNFISDWHKRYSIWRRENENVNSHLGVFSIGYLVCAKCKGWLQSYYWWRQSYNAHENISCFNVLLVWLWRTLLSVCQWFVRTVLLLHEVNQWDDNSWAHQGGAMNFWEFLDKSVGFVGIIILIGGIFAMLIIVVSWFWWMLTWNWHGVRQDFPFCVGFGDMI